MSAGFPCNPCTPACPEVVEIPGSPGAPGEAGENGTNGIDAFTILTSDLTIPAIGANVTANVGQASFAGIGQVLFLTDGTDKGSFQVDALTATTMNLEFLGYNGDSAPGAIIGSGGTVSPGGTQAALAAPLPTDFIDNSTGTPSNTIAAGVGVHLFVHPLTSLVTGLGVLAIDLLTAYVPGFRFKLLAFDFVTTVAGTGDAASQTFNLEIGTTNVTGGVLNVTLASTAAIGQVTSGSAITAANVGSASDGLSIEMAAAGTAFTAGAGYFVIRIQNMDSADGFASLAAHIDTLIVALT